VSFSLRYMRMVVVFATGFFISVIHFPGRVFLQTFGVIKINKTIFRIQRMTLHLKLEIIANSIQLIGE